MIDIVPADRGHIKHILAHLRAEDIAELTACDVDFDKLPDVIMRHRVFAFTACDFYTGPIATWGMVQRRTGVGAGYAFGTENWGKALLPMVRHIREFVLPFLTINGFHRVEAAALAYRDDVRRFMELIGAKSEGVLEGYGSGNEDFVSYRWLADEYCNTGSAHKEAPEHRHTAH